jgi:hypothetical protein
MNEARLMSVLAKEGYKRAVTGLMSSWVVWVPRDLNPGRLHLLDQVLRHCEDRSLTVFEQAASDSEAVDELLDLGVRGIVTDELGANGSVVWVLPDMIAGFTEAGGSELLAQVTEALDDEKMQGKLDKLAASGHEEQHLFLSVRLLAFSFAVYNNLAFGGSLPDKAPQLP